MRAEQTLADATTAIGQASPPIQKNHYNFLICVVIWMFFAIKNVLKPCTTLYFMTGIIMLKSLGVFGAVKTWEVKGH